MDKKEDLQSYVEDYIIKTKKRQEETSSPEYYKWLENIINSLPNNSFDDEGILYNHDISEEDIRKGSIISTFFSHIACLAKEQSVFYKENNNDYDESYYFNYNGKFYYIWTIIGQGAVTGISLCKTDQPENYVILGRELTEDEKKERELVEYIIINKDLNMSPGKIAAQVGHVCGICAEKESSSTKYETWVKKYDFKKIILCAHEKELIKLENKFYSVRDKGYTEIPENSLTAISLGIKTRKEAKPYIKRLQLLK